MAITTHVMGINAQTLAETDPETADYFVVAEVEYVNGSPRLKAGDFNLKQHPKPRKEVPNV